VTELSADTEVSARPTALWYERNMKRLQNSPKFRV